MPPLALALLLDRVLPWLTLDGRAVINTLVCENGRVGSVQALCKRVGLRTRFQLNRLLRREGLPPYEELAGWVCVFHWMLKTDANQSGRALRSLASEAHMDCASCYRLVRRVTGRRWTTLRDAGTEAAVGLFLRRTRRPRLQRPAIRPADRPVLATRLESASGTLAPPHRPPALSDQPHRVPLDGNPYGIAVRRELAYVTLPRGAAIERFDLSTGRPAGTIPLGCTPTCVVFHPSANIAYVSVQYCDEIAVIDTSRHRQTGALRVSGDPYPIVVSHSGRTLFVATNEDRLFSLCPSNGRIMGSLRLPATSHHLALHPAGGRIYVATRAGGSVLEVDTARCEVRRTFQLGGWPQGIVVSADGTLLYNANEHHGLDVIRLTTGKRIASLALEHNPVALALSPDQQLLYAGLVHGGKVCIINTATLDVSAVIDTGGQPREIAFDSRAGRVVIANEAGWVDFLAMNGRGMYHFGCTPQHQAAPVALSVS